MGKFARDTIEHLKLVFWVAFLVYLILAALMVLFGRHIGYDTMGWVCLGFASLITVVFAVIFAINLVWAVLIKAYKHFRPPRSSS